MRGAGRGYGVRRAVRGLLAAAGLAVGIAACGAPEAEQTAVPSFPRPAAEDGPAAGSDGVRVIPTDCGRILGPPDLEAVLGLPLGSVAVRTTIGVPQISR